MNPALPPLPPLQMASTSGAKGGSQGGFGGASSGDWNVNSGAGASSGMSTKTWLLLAVAGGAWFLLKR